MPATVLTSPILHLWAAGRISSEISHLLASCSAPPPSLHHLLLSSVLWSHGEPQPPPSTGREKTVAYQHRMGLDHVFQGQGCCKPGVCGHPWRRTLAPHMIWKLAPKGKRLSYRWHSDCFLCINSNGVDTSTDFFFCKYRVVFFFHFIHLHDINLFFFFGSQALL